MHGNIGYFIRIIILIKIICFSKSLRVFNNAVYILGIIFGNPCFDARCIKDSHGTKRKTKLLADWFGKHLKYNTYKKRRSGLDYKPLPLLFLNIASEFRIYHTLCSFQRLFYTKQPRHYIFYSRTNYIQKLFFINRSIVCIWYSLCSR